MNVWESFFIHILHKQSLLIEEQKINDTNLLYELAQDVALHNTHFWFPSIPYHMHTLPG